MRQHLAAVLFAAAFLASPAAAAPDQTQGVSLMSAHVSEDGALSGGAGAVSAERISTGAYAVVFDRATAGCAKVVNVGLNFANVAAIANPNAFTVFVRSPDGLPTDHGFEMIVFCPR